MTITWAEMEAFPHLTEYVKRTYFTLPLRYGLLFKSILINKCRHIVEIGTFDGITALHMIETAQIQNEAHDVLYVGFDLFEDMNQEIHDAEFSKFPLSVDTVRERLNVTGANVNLIKGDSKHTLPFELSLWGMPDFVFIDGGHSLETIASDWVNVQQVMGKHTIVMFDDYYIDPPSELDGFGCNAIVDGLNSFEYEVTHLEPIDMFEKEWGLLKVQMVEVKRR